MKWVLAALAFAVLVTVAISTVAIKNANVRTRSRIEKLAFGLHLLEMERCRQEEVLLQRLREDRLLKRLHDRLGTLETSTLSLVE